MKPLPSAIVTKRRGAGILLAALFQVPRAVAAMVFATFLLSNNFTHALGINPDPGSVEVSSCTITRTVPGGTTYDPLVLLPGGEAYELPADRTGQVSITLSINHNSSGTITTSLRDADGARITSATGNNPTLLFAPLKYRYPFIITVESPEGDPVFTRFISSGNGGSPQGPGFTGTHTSDDANIESDEEYHISQAQDSGDYDTGDKDAASSGCGSCESSSCDLSHSDETANVDTTGPDDDGRFLAGFNAGVSMQGDSQTGVDVEIDPSAGVSRSSFKSHGTGDATITRSGGNLDTITTGSAYTKFDNVTGGVKASISKTHDGTVFRTITFVNSDNNEVTRTSTFGNESFETIWSYDDTGRHPIWTVVMGNGARKLELILEEDSPTQRVQRRKLYERAAGATGDANVLVSNVLETHAKTILGWRRIKSEVHGTSGSPLTTEWQYFGPTDGLVKAGLLKSVTRPGGNTENHQYTVAGKTFHTITRPFADGTESLVETREKNTTGTPFDSYVYEIVDGNYLSERYDSWTSNDEMIRYENNVTYDLLTTHTIHAFGDDFGGIPTTVDKPDGTLVTQSHQRTLDQQQNPIFRTLTVERGAPGNNGVGEGTNTTTTRDHNAILRTKLVTAIGTGNGTLIEDFRATAFEPSTGRPTAATYFDGTPGEYSITREYACCGLASETDKYDLFTYYHYDGLGRRIRVNRQGVTQATVYDGLTVSTYRYPEDASDGIWSEIPDDTNIARVARILNGTSTTTASPDPSALDNQGVGIPGALTSTTNTTTYSSAGTARTTTIAGLGSQTTYYHPDGRIWKTLGNLESQRVHAYAVNPTGLVTASAYLVQDTPQVIAEPTAVQYDRAGRPVATGILPDLEYDTLVDANNTTGATLTNATRRKYNSVGQLESTTDADLVTTLFTYNEKGERLLTVVDLNNNYDPEESIETAIDYGIDQIAFSETVPAMRAGIPVWRTTSKVWYTSDAVTPRVVETTVSISDQSTDGSKSWSWQIGRGDRSTVTTLQGAGAWTVTTTHPDSTKTVETHTDGLLTLVEHKSADATPVMVSYTSYQHDTLKRPWKQTESSTATTGFAETLYLSTTADFVKSVTTPDGRETSYSYDSRGNRLQVNAPDTDAGNNETNTTYDSHSRVETVTGAAYPIYYTYDYAGRRETMTTQRSPNETDTTSWIYDQATGLLARKQYPDGNGTDYTYSPAGRIETRQWARGRLTVYAYTHGRTTGVAYYGTDALWQVYLSKRAIWLALLDDEEATQQEIDDAEEEMNAARTSNDTAPDTTTPNLVYTLDALGRMKTVTRGGNNHAEYDYNSNLQLHTERLQRETIDKTITRTYQTTTNVANSTVAGRPSGYTFTGGSATWTYNTAGRHHTLSDGTETFTYGYLNERIETINSPSISVWIYWNHAHNMPTYRTTWSDLAQDWYFDASAEPNLLGQRESGTAVAWHWDFETPEWQMAYFDSLTRSYDTYGQLDGSLSSETDSDDRSYTYDSIGNRLTATADTDTTFYWANAGATLAGANQLNQYVKTTYPSATIPSVHDLDGNLKTGPLPGADALSPGMPNPSEGTLTWDGENRLVKAVVNGTTVNYAYDHLSRLISRSEGVSPTTSTHYLYDGWNLIAEYTYADSEYTLAKTQLWGLDMTETPQGAGGVGGLLCIVDLVASTRHYPAYDLNGNVIAYFDSTGQPAAHFQYDPFGNLTVDEYSNAANFPYRFSTKPQDPVTGLYYYSYRYYDPVTGRWPTRDPIGEYGGINLYGFVGNDGVNDVDALGLIGKEDLLAIIVWGLATYGNFTDNIPLNDNCPKLPTSERIARDLNQRISNGTTRPNRGPGSGPMVPPASGGSPSNPAWRAPRGVPVWGVPLVWLGSTQTANAPGVVPTWGWPKRYLRLRLNESEACCDECIQNGSFVISYNKCKYDYEIKEVDDLGENVIEAGSVDTSCADGDCPGPSMWSSWTEINN